jgi:hypothetical protein
MNAVGMSKMRIRAPIRKDFTITEFRMVSSPVLRRV